MKDNRRILIFGRPGSGKTSLTVLEMVDALRNGVNVYSNIKIKWFGDLYNLNGFDDIINKLYSFFFGLFSHNRKIKIRELKEYELHLEQEFDEVSYNGYGIPDRNLTEIYRDSYFTAHKIKRLEEIEDNIIKGYRKPYYYHPKNYNFTDDLQEAVELIIKEASNPKNKDQFYMLAFDEGFIDLEHGRNVPAYVTNFFNQSRKLQVDVLIASQRPVAVYPSFRALCDYMVQVEHNWLGFSSKKYFVDDNANALPDLSQDVEGNDKGEKYRSFRGKDVFPYFDTRQSIALDKLIKN